MRLTDTSSNLLDRKLTTYQIVNINAETVTNISSTDFPGHYPGENHAWALEKFRQVWFGRLVAGSLFEIS